MADATPIFRIKTPYKKCRHCGHRVVNPHDRVCPGCHVPHGQADRVVSTAITWLGILLLVAIFVFHWPSIHEVLMEIVD